MFFALAKEKNPLKINGLDSMHYSLLGNALLPELVFQEGQDGHDYSLLGNALLPELNWPDSVVVLDYSLLGNALLPEHRGQPD